MSFTVKPSCYILLSATKSPHQELLPPELSLSDKRTTFHTVEIQFVFSNLSLFFFMKTTLTIEPRVMFNSYWEEYVLLVMYLSAVA